jgi:hypothetical protein
MAVYPTKNALIVLLSLTTLAAGGLAWSQYLKSVRLRGEVLSGGDRADFDKRLLALEKRKHELEGEVAGLRARAGDVSRACSLEPTARDANAATDRGPGRFGRANRASSFSALLENPAFTKLWTEQQKARVASAFGPLCRSLNLTPEQTAQFQSLLAERQMTMMDALSAARSQGIMGREAVGGVVQDAARQIDGQIQTLLGPDGFSQYQNYVQTQPQRNQVNQLQVALLSDGNPPLQDFQVQQLTQILARNSTAGAPGGGRAGAVYADFAALGAVSGTPVSGPPITAEAVTQAAGVLTPAQQQTLQQMQQEQAAQRQLFDAMRQGFGGLRAAGPPTTAPTTTGGSMPPPSGPPPG